MLSGLGRQDAIYLMAVADMRALWKKILGTCYGPGALTKDIQVQMLECQQKRSYELLQLYESGKRVVMGIK